MPRHMQMSCFNKMRRRGTFHIFAKNYSYENSAICGKSFQMKFLVWLLTSTTVFASAKMAKKRKQNFGGDNDDDDEDEPSLTPPEPSLTPAASTIQDMIKLYSNSEGKLIADPVIQNGRVMERSDVTGHFAPAPEQTTLTLNSLINSDIIEEGIKKDYEKRKLASLEKRADKGEVSAMNALGKVLLEQGKEDEAFHLFLRAACKGDSSSLVSAADCLLPEGKLKISREVLGMVLLAIGAERNDAESCLKLGHIFSSSKKTACKRMEKYFLTKIFNGKCKKSKKQIDEAKKLLEKSTK